MQYDPYNNPTSIMKGSLATFGYDSGGQRYKQGGEQQIIYIDKLYERHNTTKHQYYVGDYAVVTDEGASRELSYLHTDRLGSIIAISDELGNVNQDEQRGYDPFGKPREYDWNDADPNDGSNGDLNGYQKTTRGYTGHEHLNGTNLIHMNGRVYDYNLGRFMSVDPIIQAPANSQSMNPYSYIMNNPLSGTDPSGYASVDDNPGNSDTGGSGAPSTSTDASTAQRINVSQQSKTGSHISNTKVTVGDGSVTLDRSGNIIATSGNPSSALAAIGQAMAMNASQGSGASNSPTTEGGGGSGGNVTGAGSGGGPNADIGGPGDAPGNTGGGVQSAAEQQQTVDDSLSVTAGGHGYAPKAVPSSAVVGSPQQDAEAVAILGGIPTGKKVEAGFVVLRDGTMIQGTKCDNAGCTFELSGKKSNDLRLVVHTHVKSLKSGQLGKLETQLRELPGPGDHAFPVITQVPNYIRTPSGDIRVLEYHKGHGVGGGHWNVRTVRGTPIGKSINWTPNSVK